MNMMVLQPGEAKQLASLPAEWNRKRLRYLSSRPIRNGLGEAANSDDPDNPRYIRITDIAGPRHLRQDTFRSLPPEVARDAKVHEHDILISAVGATYGKSYYAQQLSSEACFAGYLVRLSPAVGIDPSFLAYWTESRDYWSQVDANVIQSTIQNFSAAKVRNLNAPVPPLGTQRRIVKFLDEKTAQIDGLLEKKHTLLDQLAEKRKSLIASAVTKGLDPTVPMKPSGFGWLGDIPAHWEVKRLKYVSPKVTVGIVVTPAAYYADDGVLAIRGLNIRPMGFDLSETRNISEEGHRLHAKSELYEGDLVAVRTGDPGTTALITKDLDRINCVDLVIIRRPRGASPRFIGWFLNSDAAKAQYVMGSEGALQLHFNVETSKEVVVPLPPSHEQGRIAEYIDHCLEIENVRTAKVAQSIELLQEYRTALVTSAVTGKIAGLQ